jgi:hypothetical protein
MYRLRLRQIGMRRLHTARIVWILFGHWTRYIASNTREQVGLGKLLTKSIGEYREVRKTA